MQDPIAEARAALHAAEDALRSVPDPAASDLIAALRSVASALDRLEGIEQRLAAQQALLDDRLLKVETNRLFTLWHQVVSVLGRWMPKRTEVADLVDAQYPAWVAHEQAALPGIERARAVAAQWAKPPKVAVVVNGTSGAFSDAIRSVHEQAYRNWELCVAVPSHLDTAAQEALKAAQTVAVAEDANPWAEAASLASADFVCFLDGADVISPYALHYLVEALQEHGSDVLYSDEDRISDTGQRLSPLFKPDWSPDLLTSCMYLGHLLMVRRKLLAECGGLASEPVRGWFHDLALRLMACDARIRHVPRVLYHSRAVREVVVPRIDSVPARRGAATVIICSRSPELLSECLGALQKTCAASVEQTIVVAHEETGRNEPLRAAAARFGAMVLPFTGPFDFALMNNKAAELAVSQHLLFLNDDVTATEPGWLGALLEQTARPNVGVAGALLRYPSGDIQHAGIVIGIADAAGHPGRYTRRSESWPWLFVTHNVSAVTGACLAIRKDVFQHVGGFDLQFPNNYNDVDLCLRVRSEGFEVVCVAVGGVVHAECRTRRGVVHFWERYRFYSRWGALLSRPDPYYSPVFARSERIALDLSARTATRRE